MTRSGLTNGVVEVDDVVEKRCMGRGSVLEFRGDAVNASIKLVAAKKNASAETSFIIM
jgi:hypothetical protein